MRNKLIILATVLLCAGAVVAIILLQGRNADDRDAELRLEQARAALIQLQSAPYGAIPRGEGDPRFRREENFFAREEIEDGKATVNSALADLGEGSPPEELAAAAPLLRADYTVIDEIYRRVATEGSSARVDRLGQRGGRLAGKIDGLLRAAGADYHERAEASRLHSIIGAAVAIALLLGAFAFFHTRSGRLEREKEQMLEASRRESLTDALTGLSNRRALVRDLERAVQVALPGREIVLALFDLDGFKQYNDSFGHPAGDALLTRLGTRLDQAVEGAGAAYRMGGDEFCVLAELDNGEAIQRAADALTEEGEAFTVSCSYGSVVIPTEVTDVAEALRVSDQRMYANKSAGRGSASRQSIDVLLQVLSERTGDLVEHVHDVAELAAVTGKQLGLGEAELNRLYAAAELHDVGKSAIPEDVLNKPGRLDSDEWEFMQKHTLIGERIVLSAPSLASTASLIRSSHERYDGGGYPDGLSGEEIPLGARIIAVCDAYDAMRTERPYSPARTHEEALAELGRCAGGQFDPQVVHAFGAALERNPAAGAVSGALASDRAAGPA